MQQRSSKSVKNNITIRKIASIMKIVLTLSDFFARNMIKAQIQIKKNNKILTIINLIKVVIA